MKRFKRDNFKEGYILVGRNNQSVEAVAIRLGVKSIFGNHTGTTGRNFEAIAGVFEAMPPVSKHTTLDEYEELMNNHGYEVQIYRIRGVSDEDHAKMAHYFRDNYLGVKYPKKRRMILLASRIYNLLYDNFPNMPKLLRLTWCTILTFLSARAIIEACLDRPDGKRKMQPSPKTVENLIVWEVLESVTDEWIEEVA